MTRGTTPTYIFTLPFDTSILSALRITYSQEGAKVITKTIADCTLDGDNIYCKLTQEETLSLREGEYAVVQLHVLTNAGDALVSEQHFEPIYPCDDNEVIQ